MVQLKAPSSLGTTPIPNPHTRSGSKRPSYECTHFLSKPSGISQTRFAAQQSEWWRGLPGASSKERPSQPQPGAMPASGMLVFVARLVFSAPAASLTARRKSIKIQSQFSLAGPSFLRAAPPTSPQICRGCIQKQQQQHECCFVSFIHLSTCDFRHLLLS